MSLKLKYRAFTSLLIIVNIFIAGMVSFAGTTNYTYDALNRLTKVEYGSGTTIVYTYDGAGNRLTMTSGDITPPTVTPTKTPTATATPTPTATPPKTPTPTATATATPVSCYVATAITSSSSTVTVAKGNSTTVTVTVTGANGCAVVGDTVKASVNKRSIATVSPSKVITHANGQPTFTITGRSKGSAKITFKESTVNLKAQVMVTVTK